VLGVFGAKWSEAIPVLRVLCLAGVAQALIPLFSTALLAKGHAGRVLAITLLRLAANGLGVLAGLHWGLVGVAYGLLVAQVLLVVPLGWVACRHMGTTWAVLLRPLGRLVAATGAAFAAVQGLALLLPDAWPVPALVTWDKLAHRWPHLVNLALLGTVGLIVLGLACWWLREPHCREAWAKLRARGQEPPAP